jgi:hypothetical protein
MYPYTELMVPRPAWTSLETHSNQVIEKDVTANGPLRYFGRHFKIRLLTWQFGTPQLETGRTS